MSGDRCPVCLLPIEPLLRAEEVSVLLADDSGSRYGNRRFECRGCGRIVSRRLVEKAAAASEKSK